MSIIGNEKRFVKPVSEKLSLCGYRWGKLLAFSYPKSLNHTVCIYVLIVHVFQWLRNYWCEVSSPTVFFTSHSALIFQLWTSCQEESGSCKNGVGGLSCSSLLGLDVFFAFQMHSVSLHVPSRSSFSKLVPCWDPVPRLSTTASSSFLCWTHSHEQAQTHDQYNTRLVKVW